MRKNNLAKERIGEVKKNNFGTLMEIIGYKDVHNITVRFVDSGYTKDASYKGFKNGAIKSPYDKSVYGIGFIGEGKYKPKENGKDTRYYKTWQAMLERCFHKNRQENHPTYFDCTVCDEWLNFQIFAKWYDENYYEVDGERIHLDKDILIKGNKIYSPETCIFVPQFINSLFIKCDGRRGELPIGVSLDKETMKYKSHANKNHMGSYTTPEEAFHVYKVYKEKVIKEVANEYKEKIPVKLCNAMISYKVEIDD